MPSTKGVWCHQGWVTTLVVVVEGQPQGHGWAVSSVRVRNSPPPLPALRAHLVTKGQ